MRRSAARAVIVHGWLWWATFALRRGSGSGVVSAFKAAQTAVAKIYP